MMADKSSETGSGRPVFLVRILALAAGGWVCAEISFLFHREASGQEIFDALMRPFFFLQPYPFPFPDIGMAVVVMLPILTWRLILQIPLPQLAAMIVTGLFVFMLYPTFVASAWQPLLERYRSGPLNDNSYIEFTKDGAVLLGMCTVVILGIYGMVLPVVIGLSRAVPRLFVLFREVRKRRDGQDRKPD